MPVVYRAADVMEAEIIVLWLVDHGIEAYVKDGFAAIMMQTPLIVAPQGVEVFVQNEEDAPRAAQLIAGRQNRAREKKSGAPETFVEATCEDCGKTAKFPSSQTNTVQSCPHCGEYVDVP